METLTQTELKKLRMILKVMKQYELNEDQNFHSENVVLLAKYFGTAEEKKQAKNILKLHLKIGYMPDELSNERTLLHDQLIYRMNLVQHYFHRELGN